VLDARGHAEGVARPEAALFAADREDDLAVEDETRLLVRVVVEGHPACRVELDEAQHHGVSEQEPRAHPGGELHGLDGRQLDVGAHPRA
jgi:hypothetical protein